MSDDIQNEIAVSQSIPEPITTTEEPKKEFNGLSDADALAKAMETVREGKEPEAAPAPSNKEVTQAVNADPEPPSEFSAAGKAAWKAKDIVGIQEEYKRINTSRVQEVSRAQAAERKAREEVERERQSVKPVREMAERVRNYLSVRGEENLPDEVKIAQALQLVDEMRKGDAKAVKAELLKMGIDLDKSGPTENKSIDPTLQADIQSLKQYVQTQEVNKMASKFDAIFSELGALTTRTGEKVFPGFTDNSETGMQFARELGSLTMDRGFRALVQRRFPNATETDFTREAYLALGGPVSGEPVKVSTQSNQKHIEKSRRATAAIPGRTTARVVDSNLRGKLSEEAALARALELHREH